MNHVSLNGLIGWLLKQTLNPVRTNQLAASITTLVLGSRATNYDERGIGGEGRGGGDVGIMLKLWQRSQHEAMA